MTSSRPARRPLFLLAACCAVFGAAAPAAPAAPPSPQQITLRLPDLPPGFEVNSAAEVVNGFPTRPDRCEPRRLGDLPAHHDLLPLATRFPHRGCEISFSASWQAPGLAPFPTVVGSAAFVFADPAGAQAALEQAPAVAAGVLGLEARWLTPSPTSTTLGDEAHLFRLGPTNAVVLWRTGPVLALMFAVGGPADVMPAALRLAAAQQARIERPAPLQRSEIDDLDVPFGHPRLDVPVRWLGRQLPARNRRPALALVSIDGPIFSPIAPEPRMVLHYGSRLHSTFVDVSLWNPRRLRRLLRRGDPDCTRRYPARLPGVRAAILGSSSFVGDRCRRPPRNPALLTAVAHFPGVGVTITAGDGWRRYDSLAGLRTLLRALRLRPLPVQ